MRPLPTAPDRRLPGEGCARTRTGHVTRHAMLTVCGDIAYRGYHMGVYAVVCVWRHLPYIGGCGDALMSGNDVPYEGPRNH